MNMPYAHGSAREWVEMMNAAMERHGHSQHPDQRLDARSWAERDGTILPNWESRSCWLEVKQRGRALHAHVDALGEQWAELPEAHLTPDRAIEKIEAKAERQIAEVRWRRSGSSRNVAISNNSVE